MIYYFRPGQLTLQQARQRLSWKAQNFRKIVRIAMGIRPKTDLTAARRNLRCGKCGSTYNRRMKRCKRCANVLPKN